MLLLQTIKSFTEIIHKDGIIHQRLSVVHQPFAHTGVDYFGQLLVKLNRKTLANQVVAKQNGAIFACLFSRVLYVKLEEELSLGSFVLEVHRLISKTGYP